MSFLDRLKESAASVLRSNPLVRMITDATRLTGVRPREIINDTASRTINTIRRGAPELRERLSRSAEIVERAQPSIIQRLAPRNGLAQYATEKLLAEPALRVAAATGLTSYNRLNKKDAIIKDSALSRMAFGSGPLSGGYTGEKGGEVVDIPTQVRRTKEGIGDLGWIAQQGEEKLKIPKAFSAPLLVGGSLLLDANPVPSADDAVKAGKLGARLLTDASGLLKNIPVGTLGDVINQADILPTVVKAGTKMDEFSTIIRTAKGQYKLIPPKQVASYLAKQTGAQVVSTLGDVSRTLGFEKAQDYAAAAAEFMKTNKIGKGFTQARARGGLTDVAANALQAKPYTPMNIAEEVSRFTPEDPFKAAASLTLETSDDLKAAVGTIQKLKSLKTSEADNALATLTQRLEASGLKTKAGQALRLIQELYARSPDALLDEAEFIYRQTNARLKKAGKPAIELTDEARKQLKYLEGLLKEVEPGSLQSRNIMAEANKLIFKNVPVEIGEALSSYFKSSLLSGPATGVINLIGTFAPTVPEAIARGFQRTVGNLGTQALLGVKGSGKFDVKKSLAAGKEALSYSVQDAIKGTNTFSNYTDGVGLGAKTFTRPDKIRSIGDVAKTGADYLERTARFFTSASDAPAREAYTVARVDEISRLARAMGQDISDPKIMEGIAEMANMEADFRFFTNPGLLATGFKKVNRALASVGAQSDSKVIRNVTKFFADATLPFVTVPPNLIARGVVDYSPLGGFKAAHSLMQAIMMPKTTANVMDRIKLARQLQQQTSRAVVGSGLAAGTAFLGYELGVMTFGKSEQEKIANLNSAQRIPPYGLNVSGLQRAYQAFFEAGKNGQSPKEALAAAKTAAQSGEGNDYWVSYDAVQPFGITIAAMGKFIELSKSNQGMSVPDRMVRAANAAAKSILGRPLFTNFKQLGSLSQDPTGAAAGYFSNVISGLLAPGALAFVAQLSDIKGGEGIIRETFSGNVGESILNKVRSRVPVLRQGLEQAVDIGGEKMTTKNPIISALGRDLAPQQENFPTTARIGLMLEGKTGMTEAIPSRYEKTAKTYGVPISLSSKDLVWARETYGKVTQKKIQRLIQDPKFLAKDSVGQANAISQEYSDVKKRLDAYFVAKQFGIEGDLSWYQWGDVFDGARKIENNNGVTLMDTLSFDRKRDFLKTYIERNNITKQ